MQNHEIHTDWIGGEIKRKPGLEDVELVALEWVVFVRKIAGRKGGSYKFDGVKVFVDAYGKFSSVSFGDFPHEIAVKFHQMPRFEITKCALSNIEGTLARARSVLERQAALEKKNQQLEFDLKTLG